MASIQTLGQRYPHNGGMLIRGSFSQKKKLWAAICQILAEAGIITEEEMKQAVEGTGKLECMLLFDDITDKTTPAAYGALCDRLRVVGRATFVSTETGQREFQVVDAMMNEIRDWDVDNEGPRCNPIRR